MLNTFNKKLSIFLMAISVIYLILSIRLPSYQYVPVDSDIIPIALGVLLLLLSIVLFFTKDQDKDKDKKINFKKKDLLNLIGIFFLILFYILLLETIGFLIVTILFIFSCSVLLGYRNHITNIIVSIVIPLSFYLLFTNLLQIRLPQGIIPF